MVRELQLKIISLKSTSSTQLYLKEQLQNKRLSSPICITADVQTDGIGSRENKWHGEEGNLFVSFAIPICNLVDDLKIESASIYFSYILKETLVAFGSKVWLKWPNDIYLENLKVGGMITSIVGKDFLCGFGLNINRAPVGYGRLDIELDKISLLESYFKNLEKKVENELEYRITSYLSIYNNMFYNYEEGKFSKVFNTLRVNSSSLNINISHLFKDSFREATPTRPRYTNYLTSSATYYYDKHYSYSASYNYDLEAEELKSLSVGFMYKKRCWDFGIRYSENRRPILNSIGEASFLEDRFIYITVILKPLMKANGNNSFISYRFNKQ